MLSKIRIRILDKEWRRSKGRYRFECNLGHLFIARYASVARPNVSGIRCPVCRIQSRERDFIAFAKQVAHKREEKPYEGLERI